MDFRNKRQIVILVIIVFLAIFLRFYKLGENPPSLTWDEVAWGYNAYSIGIDGKDEFGRFLPYDYLESFGDFKPPVYAYLDVIPIKIFGLNEFAVRFPSAFFGTLTVVVTYFLTKRIFLLNPKSEIRNPKQIQNSNHQNSKNSLEIRNLKLEIPIIATAILAISPWHIMLSRAAFEANVATFFIASGVWLFLGGVQNKRWYLIPSAIFFVLSIYTFNTARIVSPLLVLFLAFVFRKELLKDKKNLLIAFFTGLLLIIPVLSFLLSPQASLRFKEVNIFWDLGVIERTNQEIENDNNVWWSKIIHNRRFVFGVEYIKHYFDHFSPSFLFIKGDGNPKFSTQDVGQIYLVELPFLIIGTLFLFRKRQGNWFIIPLWLLIGIVPAATARETPHALRIETTLPTFQIITAVGVMYVLTGISKIKYQIAKIHIKYLIFTLYILFLLFNFLYNSHGYYTHYPREFSGEWQYGYKESIEYVESVKNEYEEVRITTALGRPYIYYLFFTKTDPEIFRKTAMVKRDTFGFVTVSGFLKYRFADSLGSIKGKARKVLYIDTPGRVHPKGDVLKKFYLLNGAEALVAYRL